MVHFLGKNLDQIFAALLGGFVLDEASVRT